MGSRTEPSGRGPGSAANVECRAERAEWGGAARLAACGRAVTAERMKAREKAAFSGGRHIDFAHTGARNMSERGRRGKQFKRNGKKKKLDAYIASHGAVPHNLSVERLSPPQSQS